jgi:enamine deaminase RidA (YjgF/YER057c/UK114 family)
LDTPESRPLPVLEPANQDNRSSMTLEPINPEELPTPDSYTQVIAATGTRLVFVAGQVADDADGNLVGQGDLSAQAHQAFANVGRALAAAGAAPEQVARITIYVVGYRPELVPTISEARIAVFGDHRPTDTLLGIEALAEPGYLIEVDAIAVLD